MKVYTEFHRDQPSEIEDVIEIIQRCTPYINRLMIAKQLVLNEGKTEAIVSCAPRSNIPPTIDTINVWGFDVSPPVVCSIHMRVHRLQLLYVYASRSRISTCVFPIKQN